MNNSNTSTKQEAPVKLTEGAVKEVHSLIQEKKVPAGYGLRIGVKGGGCAGFSYMLGFDQPGEKDNVYTLDDLNIIVEKAHELYLAGTELDFHHGLDNRGFIFNNPNAEETCGCGSSFSA